MCHNQIIVLILLSTVPSNISEKIESVNRHLCQILYFQAQEDDSFPNLATEMPVPVIQNNPMHENLMALLLLVDRFCRIVSSSAVDEKALHDLVEEFELTIGFLLVYMECLQKHPSGIFVSQLYLRLNYNGWFSNTMKTGFTIIK